MNSGAAGAQPSERPGLSPVDRRALGSVAVQFFVNGATAGTVLARFPELRDQVGLGIGPWGVLLTAVGVLGVIGAVISSSLIGRFGTRRVLIYGASGQVALLAAVGMSTQPLMLVVAMGLMSMSDVAVDVSMNLQGSWISSRRRVPVMNRLHGLWSLGTLVGGFIASRAAAWAVPLRWHLLGAAAVMVPLVWFVGRGVLTTDERPAKEARGEDVATPRFGMPILLAAFAAAAAAAYTVEQVPNEWSALRLTVDLGVDPGRAALAFVAFTAGMSIGRLVGDFLAVLLGHQGLFWTSVAVNTVGIGLAALVPNAGVVYVGFLLTGFGVASYFPTIYDDAAQFPGKTGAALSALTGGSRVAGLVVPTLVGLMSATSLSIGSSIAIVCGIALVTLATTQALLRSGLRTRASRGEL